MVDFYPWVPLGALGNKALLRAEAVEAFANAPSSHPSSPV